MALKIKKLVAMDQLVSACGSLHPGGSKTVTEKIRPAFFPDGEPPDSASIRQSDRYREEYESATKALAKRGIKLTAEQCSSL